MVKASIVNKILIMEDFYLIWYSGAFFRSYMRILLVQSLLINLQNKEMPNKKLKMNKKQNVVFVKLIEQLYREDNRISLHMLK